MITLGNARIRIGSTSAFVLAVAWVASPACSSVDCPPGTAEMDGQCKSPGDLATNSGSADGAMSGMGSWMNPVSGGANPGLGGAGDGRISSGGAATAGDGGANSSGGSGDPSAAGASNSDGGASSGASSGAMQGSASGGSEVCDNQDNDGDQLIDEGATRPCGPPMMQGVCVPGIEECVAGAWTGTCNGAVEPTDEVCDTDLIDENCDGTANENCDCTPGMTQPCGMQGGICVQGTQTCDADGHWAAECVGAVTPATEICEGALDENCDGKVDEGCDCTNGETMVCGVDVGECAEGEKTCEDGKWGSTCAGERTPGSESCDDKDNDCDGKTDEGVLNDCGGCGRLNNPVGALCSDGMYSCERAGIYVCSGTDATRCNARASSGSDEMCDSEDNDCDGRTDEGLQNDCGGPCTTTLEGSEGSHCEESVGTCSSGGTYECSGTRLVCNKCWYLCVRGESAAVRTQDPCGWGGPNDPSTACVPENPNCV